MANTYTYSGPGTRWAVEDPTAVDYLNVSRINVDHLHEALNTIMDTDAAGGVVTGTISPTTLTVSGDLTLSGGGDGALRFTNAGENSIKIPDNQASALIIEEADAAYLTFVTTNSGEKIVLGKKLEAGSVEIEGTGFDINGGAIDGTAIGAASASTGAFTTLSTTGDAGIGTGSPNGRFNVQTASRATAFSTSTGTDNWHDLVITNPSGAAGSAVGIFLQVNGYHSNAGTGIAAVAGSGDYDADLVFITRPNAASAEERMRIDSAGDVTMGNDVKLNSDSAVLSLGVGADATLTHDGTTGVTIAANPVTITSAGAATWSTSSGALTLTSAAALNITPAAGSAIVLDGTISVDAGVVTGATSITSTAFVGALTGNASGTAATVTGGTQAAITAAANLVTVGILSSGSIANGFGTINNGSNTITTTGAVSTGALTSTGNVSFDGGSFVFNEAGADKDFRIEGDTEVNLFVADASTDRIGIGVAAPGTRLEVREDQNNTTYIKINNTTTGNIAAAALRLDNDEGGGALYALGSIYGDGYSLTPQNKADSLLLESYSSSSGGLVLSSQHASADMSFHTGSSGVQRMTIDGATGRVGIGTTDPRAKFEIADNTGGFSTSDVAASVASSVIAIDGNNDMRLYFYTGITYRGMMGYAHAGDTYMGIWDNGSVTNPTLACTGGEVGIGTISPDSTLHVNTGDAGSISFSAGHDDLIVENAGAAGMTIASTDAANGGIVFATPSQDYVAEIRASYNSGSEFLLFKVADVELMTLTDTGNAGIGNTAPGATLEVSKSGSATLELSSWSINSDGVGSYLTFQKSANATVNGYATTASGERLGTIYFNGMASHAGGSVATAAQIQVWQDAGPETSYAPGRMEFYTSSASALVERMRIDSDGNVRIGTGSVWIGGTSGGDYARSSAAPHGLVINNDVTSANIVFSLKDVGITTYKTTPDTSQDDFFIFAKNNTGGGVKQYVLCGDTSDAANYQILAIGGTASATHTTSGASLVEYNVYELTAGGASVAEVTAGGNVFGIRADQNGGSFATVFLVTEDGDVFHDGTAAAMDFDAEGKAVDDIAMLSAFDYTLDPKGVIRSEWESFTRYNERDLIAAGILGDTVDNGGLTCITQMQRFHNGAIRQLERKKADRVDLDEVKLELARAHEQLELAKATIMQLSEGK